MVAWSTSAASRSNASCWSTSAGSGHPSVVATSRSCSCTRAMVAAGTGEPPVDAGAAPLAPTLASYEPYLENYELDDAVCPGTFTLTDLPWNWKVMFENFNDGYHANRLHQYVQDFCPSGMTAFPVPWDDESNVIFRTAGYTHMDGGFNATHHTIMPVFPGLTDEERTRSTFAFGLSILLIATIIGTFAAFE